MSLKSQQNAAVVDEELHDLKLRFELLEGDRKAYFENSQWAIQRNKEEINNLRAQNKLYSDAITRIKKSETDSQGRNSMTELEKVDYKILESQKKLDELQAEAKEKATKLGVLVDEHSHLCLEVEMFDSVVKDSAQAKEIRLLENRLDKAMIKYNETQSIKKTYELIVKRLQMERLSFDNQLKTLEKNLKVKKQDVSELEMMSRDANHAKEVAKAELARFEQQVSEERKQREKDLQLRKEMVKHKMEVVDKADKRVAKASEQNAEERKDDVVQVDEATEKKLVEYEETMRLIKEATGVSDLTEVIAKFQSQGATLEQLSSLQKTNEERIDKLRKKKAEAIREYEELRFTGEAKQLHSQRNLEEFKKHIEEAQVLYQETKQKYERSIRILTNAKAGIQHLNEKLESIRLPDQTSKAIVNDETVGEVLHSCVSKLEILAKNLQNKELPEVPPKDPNMQQETIPILHVNQSILPAHNTRIKMRPIEFEDEEVEDEENDDDDGGEVPDRETIKKQADQLLNSRNKIKNGKKNKKKRSTKDDEE